MKSGHITPEVIKMKKKTDKKTDNSKDTVEFKDDYQIRQNSDYNDHCKAAPNNNIFWEKHSNPLSSKGN